MPERDALAAALAPRFAEVAAGLTAPRPRRAACQVPPDGLVALLDLLCDGLGFDRLCAITGTDEREALGAAYALSHPDGTVLVVRTRVPRAHPALPTVTGRFPGAENYERELDDLLGFEVAGLAPGRRYPLPDGWPLDQKPLRKDWAPGPGVPGGPGGEV